MASPQVEQLAEQHRRRQVALRGRSAADIITLLRSLWNPQDPAGTWPAVRDALTRLLQQERLTSADLATQYYQDAREQADVGGIFVPVTPEDLAAELMKVVLDSTGIAVFMRALRAGRTPDQALATAGVTLSGSMSRLILNGGRSMIRRSVQQDAGAIGWARITDKDPCAFCAMLASRGAVYKSGETAGDVRYDGDPYHDHCGCMAAPVFSADEAWLGHSKDLYDQWLKTTKGLSGADARKEWRRRWEGISKGSTPGVQ